MELVRINTYDDPRFSPAVLRQHGGFLADGEPYEVEIISSSEAVVRGKARPDLEPLLEEFRFYAPHITRFYDALGNLLQAFAPVELLRIPLEQIQPSQFYVDEDKLAAVRTFITCPDEIIVPVSPWEGRYISLDGHTRLYLAAASGWTVVRAVVDEAGDYTMDFVREAQRRKIFCPGDMTLLNHQDYQKLWDGYCDDYFAAKDSQG